MPSRSDAHLVSTSRWQWAGLDFRVLFAMAGLVLIASLGYWLLRPVYKGWRHLQAVSLARTSLQQLEQQRPYQSQETARQAYLSAPYYVPALRLLAERAGKVSPREALGLYQRLLHLPGASTPDARRAIRLAAALRRVEVAVPLLEQLLLAEPAQVENLQLATEVALMNGDAEGAAAYARRAVLLQPTNADVQFLLARTLFPLPRFREEARTILLEVSGGFSDLSLQALTGLANDPELSPADRQLVLSRLRRHPKAEWKHQLLCLVLKMQDLPPNERRAYLTERLDKMAPGDGQLAMLGRWLIALGLPGETLRWLPLEKARQRPDWFLLHLDALSKQGRLRELMALLDDGNLPLREAQRTLYRARVANQLGDPQVELLWGEVLAAAQRDPDMQFWLSRQLEAIGQPELALAIYRQMTRQPATARYGYLQLLRHQEERRSALGIARTLQRMSETFPDDPGLLQQALYYQLLLDVDPKVLVPTLEDLVRKAPDRWSNRVTLALAYLKMGRNQDALHLFNSKPFTWKSFLPGWQAVYAACLEANGDFKNSRRLVNTIDMLRLLDPEASLLMPALAPAANNSS